MTEIRTISLRLAVPFHMKEDFKVLGAYFNPKDRFWYINQKLDEKPSQFIQDYRAKRIFVSWEHLDFLRDKYDMKWDRLTGEWWVAEKHHRKLVMF